MNTHHVPHTFHWDYSMQSLQNLLVLPFYFSNSIPPCSRYRRSSTPLVRPVSSPKRTASSRPSGGMRSARCWNFEKKRCKTPKSGPTDAPCSVWMEDEIQENEGNSDFLEKTCKKVLTSTPVYVNTFLQVFSR